MDNKIYIRMENILKKSKKMISKKIKSEKMP